MFLSSGRPTQPPSPNQMKVKMRNGFSSVATGVEHKPVSVLESKDFRHLGRGKQHVPEQFLVFRFCIGQPRDRFAWHDKHVNRRLRVDVSESNHEVILPNNISRQLAIADFLKQGLAHRYGSTRGARAVRTITGVSLLDDHCAPDFPGHTPEAIAHVVNYLIVQRLATSAPSLRP